MDPQELDELLGGLDDLDLDTALQLLDSLDTLSELPAQQQLDQTEKNNSLATAAAQLDLSRDNLFARANREFRSLINGFAFAGLGDSGFAQRERNEFGDQRERDERQLLINYQNAVNDAQLRFNRQALADQQLVESLVNQFGIRDPNAVYQLFIDNGIDAAEARRLAGLVSPLQAAIDAHNEVLANDPLQDLLRSSRP